MFSLHVPRQMGLHLRSEVAQPTDKHPRLHGSTGVLLPRVLFQIVGRGQDLSTLGPRWKLVSVLVSGQKVQSVAADP